MIRTTNTCDRGRCGRVKLHRGHVAHGHRHRHRHRHSLGQPSPQRWDDTYCSMGMEWGWRGKTWTGKGEEVALKCVDGRQEVRTLATAVDELSHKLIAKSYDEGNIPSALSPVTFAFIGDVVWELYARTKFIFPPTHVTKYRKRTETSVMAEFQAECLDKLEASNTLMDTEREMVRRGRNSNTATVPKRLRSSSKIVYQKATALECLVGFLYLTDPERLHSLMDTLDMVATHTIKIKRKTVEPMQHIDKGTPKDEYKPRKKLESNERGPPKGFGLKA